MSEGVLKFTAFAANALVLQNYTQLSANSILFIAFIKPINLFYQIIYLFSSSLEHYTFNSKELAKIIFFS